MPQKKGIQNDESATSFIHHAIALSSFGLSFYWVPGALGTLGTLFLLLSSITLFLEVHLSVRGTATATDFHLCLDRYYALPSNADTQPWLLALSSD